MRVPKEQLITAIIATILIFAVATYCAMPRLEVFAQAATPACKVVTVYEEPRMTITYQLPPFEAGVKVERRMETTTKPNPVWAPHPTTPDLPAQTMVYVDKATVQSATEDTTYHYRFFTVNNKGMHNGVPSDPICITILRPLPQTPIVVMN
jgi:hypothetical protein